MEKKKERRELREGKGRIFEGQRNKEERRGKNGIWRNRGEE